MHLADMKDYQGSLVTLATGDNIIMDRGALERYRVGQIKNNTLSREIPGYTHCI